MGPATKHDDGQHDPSIHSRLPHYWGDLTHLVIVSCLKPQVSAKGLRTVAATTVESSFLKGGRMIIEASILTCQIWYSNWSTGDSKILNSIVSYTIMGRNYFSSTDALHVTTVRITMHEVKAIEAEVKGIHSTWITISILSICEYKKLGNYIFIWKVLLIVSIGKDHGFYKHSANKIGSERMAVHYRCFVVSAKMKFGWNDKRVSWLRLHLLERLVGMRKLQMISFIKNSVPK